MLVKAVYIVKTIVLFSMAKAVFTSKIVFSVQQTTSIERRDMTGKRYSLNTARSTGDSAILAYHPFAIVPAGTFSSTGKEFVKNAGAREGGIVIENIEAQNGSCATVKPKRGL
jgi:hypothetical protein